MIELTNQQVDKAIRYFRLRDRMDVIAKERDRLLHELDSAQAETKSLFTEIKGFLRLGETHAAIRDRDVYVISRVDTDAVAIVEIPADRLLEAVNRPSAQGVQES